jgi:PAS domain S-box-containing protein
MIGAMNPRIAACLALTRAMSRTRTVEEIYEAALDALGQGLGVSRASILLFDPDGVMRFKAFRGLSEPYRRAVEGHTPWSPESVPEPIVVADVREDSSLAAFLPIIEAEGIAAMAFIPLVSLGHLIGKFMLYYDRPQALNADDLQLASVIAAQVAFAVERTRAEEHARRNEERLRFALDAALMGTWEWDLTTQSARWSDNLERLHGLPPRTFDGAFASYARQIHDDDREQVTASIRRAIEQGVPHEVEYRVVAPDGTVRWVEGKGRVEYEHGRPVRMTGVCMNVTRRKEAEIARLTAAEEASRVKEEFLATLSHELRTPLHAILGWVQMLQSGSLPPERVRAALEVITRNARLQAQLIEEILDVSRIITGKLEIEQAPMLVPQLVHAALTGVEPAAASKGIRISREVPNTLSPIEGDQKRLHQVLGNVLSNAIKFTPEHGELGVRVFEEGAAIAIEVRDSGAGIPAEFLPHVFDRFRQADSRTTRRHGGLGLGLAIARHLVERHGGEIRAESAGIGCGTTVCIRLPVAKILARPAEAPVAAVGLDAPRPRLAGLTVLVVDDQRDARELLAALCEDCGARVWQCESAEAALDALGAGRIDLLVADIAMPDVDGYELIRRVHDQYDGLPAVAVSAYARLEDREQALAAGYDGYCAKPLDAPAFLRILEDLLALAPADAEA